MAAPAEPQMFSQSHDDFLYMPDFLSDDEAALLQHQTYTAPRPKWTQLSNRRLQNWGGYPTEKGMIREPLPPWLEQLVQQVTRRVHDFPATPNHVLVNEYHPGQGIMPHTDGPIFHPTIATVSIGSGTTLEFFQRTAPDTNSQSQSVASNEPEKARLRDKYQPIGRLYLEPNSLIIVRGQLYQELHGIDEVVEDALDGTELNFSQLSSSTRAQIGNSMPRSTRLSYTIRLVTKTRDISKVFGKRR